MVTSESEAQSISKTPHAHARPYPYPLFVLPVSFVFSVYHAKNLIEHELPESPEFIGNVIHPHSCYLCNSCSTYITRKNLIEHELRESPEFIGIAIHPHSCYLCNSCSTYITRKNLIEHELRESPESIANAIHPHSCYLCNSCSTYITRNFYLNTNYANRPNPLQTPFIRIRVICVIRVQHIPRGKFDGTRISRITRIFRKRHSSAFV